MQGCNSKLKATEDAANGYLLELEAAKVTLKQKDARIENLTQTAAILKERQAPEYVIDEPQADLTDVKKSLAAADSFTASILLEYLKHDSYLIVKNLAKVTNNDNAAQSIAYRDGALSRNDAMAQLLSTVPKKDFKNRLTGQVQPIARK